MPFPVEILLATYNGEKYLATQLDSILNQTYQKFKILIRDDGSADQTLKIIVNYKKRFPAKIEIIPSFSKNIGPKNNFFELICTSKAKYLFFADQDDVWLPNKIEISLAKMRQLENENLPNTPLLVHTDLKVVDANLRTINNSFWDYSKLNPKSGTLSKVIVQNYVTGCTVVINHSLKKLVNKIPANALMHDWWLAILASSVGRIGHICEPTILYRQHQQNAVGAKKQSLYESFKRFLFQKRVPCQARAQTEAFLKQYSHILNSSNKETLSCFCDLYKKKYLKQRFLLIKHKLYKQSKINNFFWLLLKRRC